MIYIYIIDGISYTNFDIYYKWPPPEVDGDERWEFTNHIWWKPWFHITNIHQFTKHFFGCLKSGDLGDVMVIYPVNMDFLMGDIWNVEDIKRVTGIKYGRFILQTCPPTHLGPENAGGCPHWMFMYVYIYTLFCVQYIWLVVYLPLWKIWKSVGIVIPNIWKNKKKWSKPPTRYIYI